MAEITAEHLAILIEQGKTLAALSVQTENIEKTTERIYTELKLINGRGRDNTAGIAGNTARISRIEGGLGKVAVGAAGGGGIGAGLIWAALKALGLL